MCSNRSDFSKLWFSDYVIFITSCAHMQINRLFDLFKTFYKIFTFTNLYIYMYATPNEEPSIKRQ